MEATKPFSKIWDNLVSGRKRRPRQIIGGILLLIVLLLGFTCFLPYLLNLEPLREKIRTAVFQRWEWKVDYEGLSLFIFPRPHAKIHRLRFQVSEKVKGTVKSVKLYPEFRALLKGRLRIRTIEVESPRIDLRLSEELQETKTPLPSYLVEKIRESLSRISAFTLGMEAVLTDGTLNFVGGPKGAEALSGLQARVLFSPMATKTDMSCRSRYWEEMILHAAIEPASLRSQGRLELKRLDVPGLFEFLFPASLWKIKESSANIKLDFLSEGFGFFEVKIEGSIPTFALQREKKLMVLQGNFLEGLFRVDDRQVEGHLKRLSLKEPRLELSGGFQSDPSSSRIRIEMEGRNIHLDTIREKILSFLGGVPSVRTIFGYLRGGYLPQMILTSSGKSLSDLIRPENLSLAGRITEGRILVPVSVLQESIAFRGVNGDVLVSKGILSAKSMEAKWGNAFLHGAQLTIGLHGNEAPFHIEGRLRTELSPLLPLFKRLFKEETILQELAQIKKLEGRADWTFVLGETLTAIKVKATATNIQLEVQYDGLPFPLSLEEGTFSYDGETVTLRDLRGTIGRSSFSGVTAELSWRKEPTIEVKSGTAIFMLAELPAWGKLHKPLKKGLDQVGPIEGALRITEAKLKGPLLKPGNWYFETAGDWKDLILSFPPLISAGTITSPTGKFKVHPKTLSLSAAGIRFSQTSFQLSGTIDHSQHDLERMELDLEGEVRPQDISWLWDLLKVKKGIPIHSSLVLTKAHLSWQKAKTTSVRADLKGQRGVKIRFDISQRPGELQVNQFRLQDEISDCTARLHLRNQIAKISFSGSLSERTLDKIFSGYQFQSGSLQGDLQVTLHMDRTIQSRVYGRLEGHDFSFPWQLPKPLEIDHISLQADGRLLSIGEARFSWAGIPFGLSGSARFSEKGLRVDIGLLAGDLDFHQFIESLQAAGEKKELHDVSKFPIQGIVRFRANSFRYEGFTWKPFQATVTLGPETLEGRIEEAKLCGISIHGFAQKKGAEMTFDIRPYFRGPSIDEALSCLLGQEIRATGDFELKGRLYARGRPENLRDALKGNVALRAREGRIYSSLALFRILELINVTEIYRGRLPNLKKEGLPYNHGLVQGSFEEGKFVVEEAVLDGPTLEVVARGKLDLRNQEMSFVALVAPLKTVDRVIKLIPLIREILAGNLLSIPVDIHGSLKDPEVSFLSPSAVGNEILKMMKRTLKLPFTLFKPILPSPRGNGGDRGQ